MRGLLTVDPSGFRPGIAVRAALGVAIPVAVGHAVGHPTEGAIAAAGALPAGVAGTTTDFRTGSGLIAVTTLGMSVSTFVGGLVAGHLAPTLVTLAIWAFAAGLAVVLGREATIVGNQAVIGLIVFGRFPASPSVALAHAGWVLAGGALQGLLAAALRPPRPYVAERRALAHAYVQLARLAHDVTSPGGPAATTIQAAADLLERRASGDDVDLLRGLADEAERIRLELQSLGAPGIDGVPGVLDVSRASAGWLRRVSQALHDGTPPPPEDEGLAAAVDRMRAARDAAAPGPAGTPVRYAAARCAALLGQLRAVDRLTAAAAGVRRLALPPGGGTATVLLMPGRTAANVRAALHSVLAPGTAAFRHAVRLAVVLPLAEGLSRVVPGQRGYWMALTALVVLKPDYAATTERGLSRVVGTGLGVVLSGLLVVVIHPSGPAMPAFVAVFAWASYAAFGASYALYSFAITGLVVLLVAPTGPQGLATVGDRGLDTVIGGALALAAYAAWPTWEGTTLNAAISRLFAALADYADLVLGGYEAGEPPPRPTVSRAATVARRARAEAQASLERSLGEPARVRGDTKRAGGLLAAFRRIVVGLHALRTTLEDADEHVALPEIGPVREAIVGALGDLARGEPPSPAALREDQQRLAELAGSEDMSLRSRRLALVAAHLDPIVDSINTAGHVIASSKQLADA